MRRWMLFASVVVLTACGGGGAEVRTSEANRSSTTTEIPTAIATTAVPTTTAASPLTFDAALSTAIVPVNGYDVAAGDPALLSAAARQMIGGRQWSLDRYAYFTVAGEGGGLELLVYGFDATQASGRQQEEAFRLWVSSQATVFAGDAFTNWYAIEEVVEGNGPPAYVAWYHEGFGYMVWGAGHADVQRWVEAEIVAQHIQPEFITIEEMEGAELPGLFADLGGDCGWWPPELGVTPPDEQLFTGNDWRSGDYPLAEHFALRDFSCGTAQSGSMSIVQMQQEFVDHGYDLLAAGDQSDVTTTQFFEGVQAVVYEGGVVRWMQGPFLYQLVSATTFDAAHPDGAQSVPDEQLLEIAATLITANAAGG